MKKQVKIGLVASISIFLLMFVSGIRTGEITTQNDQNLTLNASGTSLILEKTSYFIDDIHVTGTIYGTTENWDITGKTISPSASIDNIEASTGNITVNGVANNGDLSYWTGSDEHHFYFPGTVADTDYKIVLEADPTPASAEYIKLHLQSSNGNSFDIERYNNSAAPLDGGYTLISDIDTSNGAIGIRTGDPNDYLLFHAATHIPKIGCQGCTTIYFQDLDGASWEDVDAGTVTQHSQDISSVYQGDFRKIKRDVKAIANGEHPLYLVAENRRNKIINRLPMEQEEYDDPGTDLGAMSQLNAKTIDYLMTELCKKDNSYGFCVNEAQPEVKPPRRPILDGLE